MSDAQQTTTRCPWRIAYDFAIAERAMWWRTYEQASTDRTRTESGLMAEAWDKVATDIREAASSHEQSIADGGADD